MAETSGAEDLLAAALRARENAHAPYSGFRVGAALRTASGRVHAGCNVENAAYPEGTCAEAGAIAAMVAAGEREIVEILVLGDSPTPCTPCGGCRQKLAEFAAPSVPVRMADLTGVVMETTIGALLPHAFAAAHLPSDPGVPTGPAAGPETGSEPGAAAGSSAGPGARPGAGPGARPASRAGAAPEERTAAGSSPADNAPSETGADRD